MRVNPGALGYGLIASGMVLGIVYFAATYRPLPQGFSRSSFRNANSVVSQLRSIVDSRALFTMPEEEIRAYFDAFLEERPEPNPERRERIQERREERRSEQQKHLEDHLRVPVGLAALLSTAGFLVIGYGKIRSKPSALDDGSSTDY